MDSHIDDQCWFVLQDHFRSLYTPHLLYASEVDCEELEPESRSITDICTKLRVGLERLVASQAAKMNTDPKPPVLVEPDVLEEIGSEVVVELKPEPESNNAAKPEPAIIDEL